MINSSWVHHLDPPLARVLSIVVDLKLKNLGGVVFEATIGALLLA